MNVLIDSCFPFPSFRTWQRECIQGALHVLYDLDYDVFFVDAPVGFGKSPTLVGIASTAFAAQGITSYYLTPQKILQDQLLRDFPQMPQIKGRDNYPCLESVDRHDVPPLTCEMGSCLREIGDHKSCVYYPTRCPYLVAREKCLNAPLCGMNMSYFLVAKTIFEPRDLLIVDEAHDVPEWGVKFVELIITERDVGKIPILNIFSDCVNWLETTVRPAIWNELDYNREKRDSGFFYEQFNHKRQMGDYQHYFSECTRLERILSKITELLDDYKHFGEYWVMAIEDMKHSKDHLKQIRFTPITSARFLAKLLWSRGKKIIVASGTIVPDYYIAEAGLGGMRFNKKECVFSVPSEFPPERSPIYYYPVGKMSLAEKNTTFPKMIEIINRIIAERQDRRGIIHCRSYTNADYIEQHIDPQLQYLIFIQDRYNRDESLQSWLQDKHTASVFVSTAMTEGIDLKDDLCLLPSNAVLTKMGFVPIETCNLQTEVTNNNGKWTRINAVMRRNYQGDIIVLKSQYINEEIRVTPDHRVLVSYMGHILWKRAKDIDIKKDRLVYPIQQEIHDIEEFQLNEKRQIKNRIGSVKCDSDLMRLFGYYISEGSLSASHISFSFNIKEDNLVMDVNNIISERFGYTGTITPNITSNSQQLTFCLVSLVNLMRMFGRGAKNKQIPPNFLFLSIEKQRELIKGMWLGDGTVKGRVMYRTASKELAKQLCYILLRLGYVSSISFAKSKESYVRGRLIRASAIWSVIIPRTDQERFCKEMGFTTKYLHLNKNKNWTCHRYIWRNGKLILPISEKRIEQYTGFVYNIEAEIGESFVTQSFCVHNCRYQIYVKMAYPDLSDPRIAKRKDLGHKLWMAYQPIEDCEQASGRATRSKEDCSEMFLLDGSFGYLWVRYHKYFKTFFVDRVIPISSLDEVELLTIDRPMIAPLKFWIAQP